MRARRSRRNWFAMLGVFVAVFAFAFLVQRFGVSENADAANMAGFDPGYIMSDYQMGNYNSMSEAQIQAFLTAKNPCGNTDYNYYTRLSANKNYTWHFANGHFICLSEERFGDGEVIGSGETAAHIIWKAAQDYRINPQALIVLLQKETGLITDPIPNNGDYRKATGYGCPDTAPCSAQYYGLKNQVRHVAALFRDVLNGGWTNYPLGNNYVKYNPNSACGGKTVNIRSLATSALYRYTPYQPNGAALSSSYGTGDSCSSYGNRNFYSYFEDWFGDIMGEGLKIPESSYVVEGEYVIKSKIGSTSVLDVAGGSAANGANIQTWTNNGSNAQKWKIVSDGNGSYIIKNATTGKVLDVAGGNTGDGGNVQSYAYNGSCAQKWKIVRDNSGNYVFYSSCSGRVLDIAGGSSANGANVQIYRPNGSSAQKWNLISSQVLTNGEYTISSGLASNMVIDINGGVDNVANGANIQIYSKNNSDAQRWKVTYGSDGYYTIYNTVSGKSLDVVGSGKDNGTNVQAYSSNGSCAQKWQIVKENNNRYMLYSACSGLALDVAGGNTSNGANVQIYTANGTSAQKWSFEMMRSIGDGNYIIKSSMDNNKAIDVSAGSLANSANIQLWQYNGSGAQKWQIKYDGNGAYTIVNVASKKVLDVAFGGTHNGANVQQYVGNGSCAQKWQVLKNGGGSYSLYSACSNKVIDATGGSSANGTNIQIYDFNGSVAQKWKLVKY